jgi:hypothetical protein
MAPRIRRNHFFMPISHAIGGPASPAASHEYPRATLQGKVPARILKDKKADDEGLSYAEFASPRHQVRNSPSATRHERFTHRPAG